MKERKLNYRFHNPNPAADTADYIFRVLVEANMGKVEHVIQDAAKQASDDGKLEKTKQQ